MPVDSQELSEEQWFKIKGHLPSCAGRRGPMCDNRKFLNGLLWLARSGARWRDIPERYGKWESIKRRYYRWVSEGVFDELFELFSADADLEWWFIDSTVVRAHQHAAGAPKKTVDKRHRLWGVLVVASVLNFTWPPMPSAIPST
jgi:transposase